MAPGPPWGVRRGPFPASVGAVGRPRWGQHQARGNERQKRMKRDSFPAFRMPNADSNMLGKWSRAGSGYLPEEPGIRTSPTPVSLFRRYHLILGSGLETRFLLGVNRDSVHIQVSPDCEELGRGPRM